MAKYPAFAAAAVGLLTCLSTSFGAALAQQRSQVAIGSGQYAGEMEVPANKSQILRIDQPYRDLLVGNPEIADVMPITDRSVYVLGKQAGSTSLTIYGPNKKVLGIIDLSVVAN